MAQIGLPGQLGKGFRTARRCDRPAHRRALDLEQGFGIRRANIEDNDLDWPIGLDQGAQRRLPQQTPAVVDRHDTGDELGQDFSAKPEQFVVSQPAFEIQANGSTGVGKGSTGRRRAWTP